MKPAEGSKFSLASPTQKRPFYCQPCPTLCSTQRGQEAPLEELFNHFPACKSFLMTHFICSLLGVGMAEAPIPGTRMSQLSSEGLEKPSQKPGLMGDYRVGPPAKDYSHFPTCLQVPHSTSCTTSLLHLHLLSPQLPFSDTA